MFMKSAVRFFKISIHLNTRLISRILWYADELWSLERLVHSCRMVILQECNFIAVCIDSIDKRFVCQLLFASKGHLIGWLSFKFHSSYPEELDECEVIMVFFLGYSTDYPFLVHTLYAENVTAVVQVGQCILLLRCGSNDDWIVRCWWWVSRSV